MRVLLFLVGLSLALPGGSAVAQAFQGQVDASPMPKVRVVRPSEPGQGISAPQPQPQGSASSAETDDANSDQPRVVRLNTPESAEEKSAEAGDGSWRGDRDERFKRAPKPTASFKPDEGPPPIVPIRTPSTRLKEGARLRQLDKMTGQIQTYDVAVGETVRVARLQVRLDACRSPSGNDSHGTMAFLKIWDTKLADAEPDFSGWMFAESPALSALDHPRYDVWVINCTTPLGE
ncbi:MAG: DUF2155 domain-containing protein [Pseudomonadota bacterium]